MITVVAALSPWAGTLMVNSLVSVLKDSVCSTYSFPSTNTVLLSTDVLEVLEDPKQSFKIVGTSFFMTAKQLPKDPVTFGLRHVFSRSLTLSDNFAMALHCFGILGLIST